MPWMLNLRQIANWNKTFISGNYICLDQFFGKFILDSFCKTSKSLVKRSFWSKADIFLSLNHLLIHKNTQKTGYIFVVKNN